MHAFDFLALPVTVTLLFLWMLIILVNMPAWRTGVKKSPFQQTLEDFYRALPAISLKDFGGCPADLQNSSSPGQNKSRSRQLWQVFRGSNDWGRLSLETEAYLREDNKACKKCERVRSESMTRRQRQVSVISVVFAPGSAQSCWGDVASRSEATWFGASSLS